MHYVQLQLPFLIIAIFASSSSQKRIRRAISNIPAVGNVSSHHTDALYFMISPITQDFRFGAPRLVGASSHLSRRSALGPDECIVEERGSDVILFKNNMADVRAGVGHDSDDVPCLHRRYVPLLRVRRVYPKFSVLVLEVNGTRCAIVLRVHILTYKC